MRICDLSEKGDGALSPRSGSSPSHESLPAGRRRSLAPHPSGGEAEAVIGGHPVRWEPEGLSLSGIYPRSVIPGIENQMRGDEAPEPGVYVRLDWLRSTGPEACIDAVRAVCEEHFGGTPRTSVGAKYFAAGWEWEPGVQLSHGHKCGICMLDVRGERLKRMTGEQAIEVLRALLALGFRATRIDGAVDWVGQGVSLYRHALASCEAGELCRLRSYSPRPEYRANGEPIGLHLSMGKRESAVCVRVYDKGLERKAAPCGYWERFEAEFKDDRAATLALELCDAGDAWLNVLTECVVGAVDFRQVGTRSELLRRERCPWWERLIEGISPRVLAPDESPKSFETWLDGLRRSYLPKLAQMAAAVGRRPGELLEDFLRGVKPAEEDSAALREFVALMRGKSEPALAPVATSSARAARRGFPAR